LPDVQRQLDQSNQEETNESGSQGNTAKEEITVVVIFR
jgi:hypothetical protein